MRVDRFQVHIDWLCNPEVADEPLRARLSLAVPFDVYRHHLLWPTGGGAGDA